VDSGARLGSSTFPFQHQHQVRDAASLRRNLPEHATSTFFRIPNVQGTNSGNSNLFHLNLTKLKTAKIHGGNANCDVVRKNYGSLFVIPAQAGTQ
jgi:hypothetical protein